MTNNDVNRECQSSRMMFISWAPFCSRSDAIGARLGGESHMVYCGCFGSHWSTILFKYLAQAVWTLVLLIRKRPSAVFVMTPPIVACIPVWFYCIFCRAKFAIDAHTGAFDHPRWKRLQFLQRFFSRRAETTIVTNDYLADTLRDWNCQTTIISDVPIEFGEFERVELDGTCNMTHVSSFNSDEPIEIFLEAARLCPQVQFHVTGDLRHANAKILDMAPSNVKFTGFLSVERYASLLDASDAVLALTTRDHTMQRAAYEAAYLATPVITTDFPLLQNVFYMGTVHVAATVESLVDGIREMQANLPHYRTEISKLRLQMLRRWDVNAKKLCNLMSIHRADDIAESEAATF